MKELEDVCKHSLTPPRHYDAPNDSRDDLSVNGRYHNHSENEGNPMLSPGADSRGSSVYERGIRFKAALEKKRQDILDQKYSSPSKIIPLSKACAIYDREMSKKKENEKKRQKLAQIDCSPPSSTITLADASGIYERGLRFKAKIAVRLEEEKKDIELLSSPDRKVIIPPSRATRVYDRGMMILKEKSRKISEDLCKQYSTKTESPKISKSRAVKIYERGVHIKANLEKKRQEESMKKKWR